MLHVVTTLAATAFALVGQDTSWDLNKRAREIAGPDSKLEKLWHAYLEAASAFGDIAGGDEDIDPESMTYQISYMALSDYHERLNAEIAHVIENEDEIIASRQRTQHIANLRRSFQHNVPDALREIRFWWSADEVYERFESGDWAFFWHEMADVMYKSAFPVMRERRAHFLLSFAPAYPTEKALADAIVRAYVGDTLAVLASGYDQWTKTPDCEECDKEHAGEEWELTSRLLCYDCAQASVSKVPQEWHMSC